MDDASAGGSQEKCPKVEPETEKKLSDAQRARIERNRQKALLLKQSRLSSQPYTLGNPNRASNVKLPAKPKDTGGGFLVEDDEEASSAGRLELVHPRGPMLGAADLVCVECGKAFTESYLMDMFDVSVCDKCRDAEEKHKLITKTVGKDSYCLKDADFDKREPPLKFIVKKNPRNQRWGDMKLFLESQVKERALEVWGSWDKLEEHKEEKAASRENLKHKRFDKKVKELRMAVRSSLWKKDLGTHEHEYGPEAYNEKDDVYTKTCTTCGHVMSYEKM